MWAQQDRFADLARFRSAVAAMGYDAIEVSHSTDEAGLNALLTYGEIPLSSLHAPAPRRSLAGGRNNGDTNLASLDEDARRLAIAETKRTIDFAARGALSVVIHLGAVGEKMTDAEARLRLLVSTAEGEGEEAARLREEMRRWRSANAGPHLEAAARSLRELVDYAAPRRVVLGIESRLHYHEIPHPQEAQALLAGYTNEEAGYWHDTGHCEVQARLGLIDRGAWFPLLTERTVGSHLHDVDGLADHRAPGNGDVDWAYIAAGLPKRALRVLEINQGQPDAKVAGAIRFLRERGVV
jgi:sugar phosphate isomerase/epimerase